MVEQSRELPLLPFRRRLGTPCNPWDTRSPLCVGLVLGSTKFALGHALPSPTSAKGRPFLFGSFIGTTAWSDSSRTYMSALWLSPSRTGLDPLAAETPWTSPGSLACCFSTCLGSATKPGPASARDLSPPAGVTFSLIGKDRHPDLSFSRLNTQPADAFVYASPTASQRPAPDSRSGRSRYSFPVGPFHPLQTCRFIPAHPVLDPVT